MPDVPGGDLGGEFDLHPHQLPVNTFDDEIDFSLAGVGAQVTDARLGRLRRHPDRQRAQGLEERAGHAGAGTGQQSSS